MRASPDSILTVEEHGRADDHQDEVRTGLLRAVGDGGEAPEDADWTAHGGGKGGDGGQRMEVNGVEDEGENRGVFFMKAEVKSSCRGSSRRPALAVRISTQLHRREMRRDSPSPQCTQPRADESPEERSRSPGQITTSTALRQRGIFPPVSSRDAHLLQSCRRGWLVGSAPLPKTRAETPNAGLFFGGLGSGRRVECFPPFRSLAGCQYSLRSSPYGSREGIARIATITNEH